MADQETSQEVAQAVNQQNEKKLAQFTPREQAAGLIFSTQKNIIGRALTEKTTPPEQLALFQQANRYDIARMGQGQEAELGAMVRVLEGNRTDESSAWLLGKLSPILRITIPGEEKQLTMDEWNRRRDLLRTDEGKDELAQLEGKATYQLKFPENEDESTKQQPQQPQEAQDRQTPAPEQENSLLAQAGRELQARATVLRAEIADMKDGEKKEQKKKILMWIENANRLNGDLGGVIAKQAVLATIGEEGSEAAALAKKLEPEAEAAKGELKNKLMAGGKMSEAQANAVIDSLAKGPEAMMKSLDTVPDELLPDFTEAIMGKKMSESEMMTMFNSIIDAHFGKDIADKIKSWAASHKKGIILTILSVLLAIPAVPLTLMVGAGAALGGGMASMALESWGGGK